MEGPAEFFRQLGLGYDLGELRLAHARWGLLDPRIEIRGGGVVYPRLATAGEE